MLPGTNRAADRFVRASFYIDAIPKTAKAPEALAGVFSVMRNVSVPLDITTPSQPNISSTIWRTVADQKNKVYYFESTLSPTVFWVPLAELDLNEGAPVKKLTLVGGRIYSGSAASQFEPAQPFAFLPAAAK
jgi:penicillin V acylase-like amidase (Ntn superfamily)